MSSASWHARINCGRDTGAGFLVTERHVLTCAHVVAHSETDPVAVSFAHGGEGEVSARVIAHGGWDGRDTDPGDLAVLELDRSVSLKPAEFATPSDAYGNPRAGSSPTASRSGTTRARSPNTGPPPTS